MHSLVLEGHGQAGETSSYRRMKDGADCEEGSFVRQKEPSE